MFFFFKQKTAYEMLRSLVGSEMCIRDRSVGNYFLIADQLNYPAIKPVNKFYNKSIILMYGAVSYTHLTLPTIYSV